jgi:hypothetical protein
VADPRGARDSTGDAGDNTGTERDYPTAPRTPRWVLVFGIIAVVLILLVLAQLLLGIQHGPGMHGPSSDAGAAAPGASWAATALDSMAMRDQVTVV